MLHNKLCMFYIYMYLVICFNDEICSEYLNTFYSREVHEKIY